MHAVLVSVTVHDGEAARARLRDVVVPMVREAPGAIAGYWLAADGDTGNSIVVFDSEANAQNAANSVTAGSGAVTIDSVTVREVIASL